MLAANVCAAEFLMKNKHTALFRNHLGPTPEKLATLREQLGLIGFRNWAAATTPDAERTMPHLPNNSKADPMPNCCKS